MAAGNTYVALATQTLSTNTANVTFSSISGSYTDLKLVFVGPGDSGSSAFYYRFNGDSGSNYSMTELKGDGSGSSTSARYSGETYMYALGHGFAASESIITTDFMNYSNTTTNKTALTRWGDSQRVAQTVGLWRSTAAINSISIHSLGTFISGSTFSLYGIAYA
jgi:hypothetical protein